MGLSICCVENARRVVCLQRLSAFEKTYWASTGAKIVDVDIWRIETPPAVRVGGDGGARDRVGAEGDGGGTGVQCPATFVWRRFERWGG